MRVFHFVNDKYGIENIRHRRLKVATIHDLNDPFELISMNLRDRSLRRFFALARKEFATKVGLLCFSKGWRNPVLWSHYAAGHAGLCLGFDVPEANLAEIRYSDERIVVRSHQVANVEMIDSQMIQTFMHTKYSHWRYEAEVRSFVRLPEKDPETNMHYASFADDLRLAEVIVGARSKITNDVLAKALNGLSDSVVVTKARLAFQTFKVVRQRNRKLWLERLRRTAIPRGRGSSDR